MVNSRRVILTLATVLLLPVWLCAQSLQVGYSVFTADSGSRIPVGAALFRVSDNTGVVVSEAGVGAAEPILKGRIFVDEVGTRMALAIVNANAPSALITFILRDAGGTELARKGFSLGANQHLPIYVADLFPAESVGLRGSLTFESSQPLAAVTVRENHNGRGESLYTTLPVINLAATPSSNPVVFPHIAAGGGNTTQVLLMNPTSDAISGEIDLFDSDGQPASVQSDGQSVSRIPYTIGGDGTFRVALTSSILVSGWAEVRAAAGNAAPSGSVIFQVQKSDQVVSEAGVGATNAIRTARIFVDNAQTQTGVAIVNPTSTSASVVLTLLDRNGNVEDTKTRTIPAGNHLAFYVNDVFSTVTDGFTGLMEIRSSVDVASVTLKLTVNARGDLIVTTLPVADVVTPPASTTIVFPQIGIGGAFSTRLILINTDNASKASGRLSFYRSDSKNMVVPMADQTASSFVYQVSAGGGRQFYPGNTARAAAISVIDPSSGQTATEVTINEGNTLRPRLRVSDSAGAFRDDFDSAIQSLDTSVASVDASGAITGQSAGFSTLTITSQNVVTILPATVVRVNSGITGFQVQGIAQDLANRLYLAASSEQAILLAEDVKQSPATYAGIRRNPGLKNGARLDSQFRNPAFLALDQARGTLYVSDGSNHAIRRVNPGASGTVETLAGTGTAGSQDGPLNQASFNNPQGIALDNRGNLWVADSGNHTIRRINLQTGVVQTVAGLPGTAGFAEGQGQAARFRNPVGIAIENETSAQQIARERQGQPPPPVRVLVADSGNNAIRRVTEDGRVETVSTPPSSITAPTAVAVDSFDNIFVTESASSQVQTILTTGAVVPAAQRNTFGSPSGIAITRQGRVVVGDGKLSAQEIVYGEPQILSVTPTKVSTKGGATLTIKGKNFAPDSIVIVADVRITGFTLQDTTTISLVLPAVRSGVTTVSVQNRGGLSQTSLTIDSIPLSDLLPGQITTVAGGSTFIGDGSNAISADLFSPVALTVDAAGNLFIADSKHKRVRKVAAATGIITTVAGVGEGGTNSDGVLATTAALGEPGGIVLNASGDLFVSTGDQIRKITAATGIITTVVKLRTPGSLAIDGAGNLFITNTPINQVLKLSASTGKITSVAGDGYADDGAQASTASLASPQGLAVDAGGNLYIADTNHNRIRKVDALTGIISTVAGNGQRGSSGDGGSATTAALDSPFDVAVNSTGDVFISERTRIRRVAASTGTITTILNASSGALATDGAGNVFIGDTVTNRVQKLTTTTGSIIPIAGKGGPGFSGDGGPATNAELFYPFGVAVDKSNNVFIAGFYDHKIRRIDAVTGFISTVAGNGHAGYSGDGGPAAAAALFNPAAVATDASGNLFIADTFNNRIRKVDVTTGIITTVAGTGVLGSSGDGGPATSATLTNPAAIAVDSAGNLLISDVSRVRKVNAATGVITAFAGTGSATFSGDGGPARFAGLSAAGFALDSSDNVFITDFLNNRIRKVTAATGIITTVAGSGVQGLSGDGGPAVAAALNQPLSIAVDASGNLFILDSFNNRIRKLAASTGIITSIAGKTSYGYSGDGGPATEATFYLPWGIALDRQGNLFIADSFNNRIRAIRGPIP